MSIRISICLVALVLSMAGLGQETTGRQRASTSATKLRQRIAASPLLPFHGERWLARPDAAGWEAGTVSGVAVDRAGVIYEIQRGDKTDPIVVLDRDGHVLRSFGKGDFVIPHSIRVDDRGNVWAVDAGASVVIEYSAQGRKLQTIVVGEQPENGSSFNGTTDIAFGPSGNLFITDGYGNARILEYTTAGQRVRQWGGSGRGPGEFNLPHAIGIHEDGIMYVADRENGRIEKFNLDGKYLGEFGQLGRVYALTFAGDALWVSMGPFDEAPGSAGWLVKLDRRTGKMLGHLDVPAGGGHSVACMPTGEPILTLRNGLFRFKEKR